MKGKVDYRKALEKAARQMVLVYRVDTLIKLILRAIVRDLKISHAGLFLYDGVKKHYVVRASKGRGVNRIPSGFIKVRRDNSLIKYFTDKKLRIFDLDFLTLNKVNSFLRSKRSEGNEKLKTFFEGVKFQLSLYKASVCLAGFFRDTLICVLFLGKKNNHKKLTQDELSFLSVLSSDMVMAIENALVFQGLAKQLEENKKIFLQTVMALSTAIEAKDKYTLGHTDRVSKYSLIMAEEIKAAKKNTCKDWDKFFQNLRVASLLHDIGKIGIDEAVLNKKGLLNDEERRQMQKHPLTGFSILKHVHGFKEPILGVRYHHERHDGKGYPDSLKGKKIPLIAQIISVVDAFDAMTSNRSYRKGFPKEKAVNIIKENRGKQFSPFVVDTFLSVYDKGKI